MRQRQVEQEDVLRVLHVISCSFGRSGGPPAYPARGPSNEASLSDLPGAPDLDVAAAARPPTTAPRPRSGIDAPPLRAGDERTLRAGSPPQARFRATEPAPRSPAARRDPPSTPGRTCCVPISWRPPLSTIGSYRPQVRSFAKGVAVCLRCRQG
jgi:hypothetical protein